MVVVFLILTFAGFVVIDFLLNRKPPVRAAKPEPAPVAPFLQPSIVAGLAVPEELRYHPGHAWLYRERKNLCRVGVDEFAALVAGSVDGIELPKPGQWVRQGQKAWTFTREGRTIAMASPTEGEVVAVNEEVQRHPELLHTDPYGKGWLFTIHVPDEESTTRNLVPQWMVPAWMRNAVDRLYSMQPLAAAPGTEQPAGIARANLPEVSWPAVSREFFLTA